MPIIIFWISFFAIAYTYFGYILLCILLGKLLGKDPVKKEFYPGVSIIVACYNEENVIRAKIDNLLALDYPKDKLQIMIASESTDRTDSIIGEYAGQGIELYKYSGRNGKPKIIYKTVPQAKGEILIFTDANIMVKNDAVKIITRLFSDPQVGAATGLLTITNPTGSSISRGESIYKKYESALRRSNSRLGRVLNSDGALFALRKELYRPISPDRGDDFELVIRVLINNYKSVFEPQAIVYEDASTTAKAEISRKIRMVSWFTKSTFLLIKEMCLRLRFDLVLQIISHKLMRWFTPYFFISLLISNAFLTGNSNTYRLFLILQTCVYVFGIIGVYQIGIKKKKPHFFIGAAYYFLTYNYAFLIGTIKGIFPAKTSSSWEKTRG